MNESIFVVENVNGYVSIGTGANGVKTGLKVWDAHKKLIIPSVIDGQKIEEISKYAFYTYKYVEEVIISDGIKTIRTYAFGHCENLVNVIIAPSVERLESYSIHCYNHSYHSSVSDDASSSIFTTKGVLTITFLPNSNLKYLADFSICRRENIVIYFLGYSSPETQGDPFNTKYLKSLVIYSPYIKVFGGYNVKGIVYSCKVNCSKSFNSFLMNVLIIIIN